MPLSDIDLYDRVDSEAYTKENIAISKMLHSHSTKSISELSKLDASAFYPAATELYQIGNIPFIRCVDCINYLHISKRQEELFERIPEFFIRANKSIATLTQGDIVITKVGSPCYASLVGEDYSYVALSRTVLGLKNIVGINPAYLTVFLRSFFGFKQLLRARELTIQYQLTLDRVRNIDVFIPSMQFQINIERAFYSAMQIDSNSESIYKEAEQLLLQELGLTNWQPTNQNNNTKTFAESFLNTGRFDAEYYQPKYDEVENRIKLYENGFCELKDIIQEYSTGYPFESDIYVNSGVALIRISNIKRGHLDTDNTQRIPIESTLLSKKDIVKENDILLSMSGTIGNCCVVPKGIEAIINQRILKFSIKDFNPNVLSLLVNSPVGQMQLNRVGTGGVQTNISVSDIFQILIPRISMDVQKLIAERIQNSFVLKEQSKELLERAKRAVEIAIEQNEEVALKYLEEV
ncbi:MAG: restriction endonuclease subunit S [Candidatus Kapaibacterium sp.]